MSASGKIQRKLCQIPHINCMRARKEQKGESHASSYDDRRKRKNLSHLSRKKWQKKKYRKILSICSQYKLFTKQSCELFMHFKWNDASITSSLLSIQSISSQRKYLVLDLIQYPSRQCGTEIPFKYSVVLQL